VLRDKLRAAGYKAFTEKGGDSRKPVFRVKVGPEPERNRAVAMQAKLKSREKLKGIVLKQQ
jgi:cell division septation protein DedD